MIGAGGFEHQRQDNFKAKLALDLAASHEAHLARPACSSTTPTRTRETYLATRRRRVFSGTVNIDGRAVTIPASAFSNQVYRLDERHWMHALSLEQARRRVLLVAASARSTIMPRTTSAFPSTALPGAQRRRSRARSSGWTAPAGARSTSTASRALRRRIELHVGAITTASRSKAPFRHDRLAQRRRRRAGPAVARPHAHARPSGPKTTGSLAPSSTLTLGARYEWWKAYGGRNFSAAPALDVDQPEPHRAGPLAQGVARAGSP